MGIAAFAVWVLESLIRRRFREALIRGLLVLLPVVGWQAYVASVERSEAYRHPAYEYQRAPYLFYNVSYARNVVFRDPFTPEKGQVRIVRRLVRNAIDLPVNFGETLSASRGYLQMGLHGVFGSGPIASPLIGWGVYIVLALFGGTLVTGGIVAAAAPAADCRAALHPDLQRGHVPHAVSGTVPAVSHADHAAACARRPSSAWMPRPRGEKPPARERRRWFPLSLPGAVLGSALLIQVLVTVFVYLREYRPIAYVDVSGRPVAYRLFFYNEAQRGFDEAIEYIRAHAGPTQVVAAGTPHWIHLRTGLKTVMPPLERDVDTAQRLLDSVPVRYLVIGRDVVATERYTVPVVQRFADRWQAVYATAVGGWTVYRRAEP